MELVRRTIDVQGLSIEVHEGGRGDPLLFLHDHDGVDAGHPFLCNLARHFRVIAPSHPGFGTSSLPEWMNRIEDFAFVYLDLIEQLHVESLTIVGASIGGWIAAELGAMASSYFSRVVLIAPVGIKTNSRDELTVPDLFAKTIYEVREMTCADPEHRKMDISQLGEADLTAIARNRETLALTAWEPYMHNPKLIHRLHRLRAPTLLIRGDKDSFVSTDYFKSFAKLIPGSQVITIGGGGHFVHLDQPNLVSQAIKNFVASSTVSAMAV